MAAQEFPGPVGAIEIEQVAVVVAVPPVLEGSILAYFRHPVLTLLSLPPLCNGNRLSG
jgi:hypothetical protein